MAKKKKNVIWLYLSPQNFRGKITMGITLMSLLAALTLVGTWGYINNQIITQYNHIIENTAPTQYYSKVIEDCISSSTSLTAIYLATSEEEYRAERENVWKDCEVALNALSNYTDQWRNEAVISLVYDVRTKANRLRKEQNNVEQKYFARNADLKEDSKIERVRQVDQLELLTDDVRAVLELIINIQNEEIDRAKAAIDFHTQNLWVIVLPAWVIILTIVCVWIAYSINHKLLFRLHTIKNALRQIAKGNLSNQIKTTNNDEITPIETALNHLVQDMERLKVFAKDVGNEKFDTKVIPFNENGEVGQAFINMRDSLKTIAEKDEQLNWAVTGETHFAKILRDFNDDIDELTQIFVSELVKYLNISQATLYLINPEIHSKKELELKAWFAYDSYKNRKNTIQIGEGLIGETFQENRTLYLENLPNDYLHIGSALGSAKPISLLFVPLKISEENIGILELAAFKKLKKHEIDFVEKVCENITSSIISVQNTTRTRKLLEESQMQREAVLAQEEEMRQNVEELQATQEEMERKQKETEQLMLATKDTETQLRMVSEQLLKEKATSEMIIDNIPYAIFWKDKEGYFLGCNTNLVQILGFKTKQEIIGKNDFDMPYPREEALAYRADDKLVMDSNQAKMNIIEPQITEGGKTTWLNTSKIPLRDNEGKVVGIVGMFKDITQEKEEEERIEKQSNRIEKLEEKEKELQQKIALCQEEKQELQQQLKGKN